MVCKPVIDGNPTVTDNDLTFTGYCDGNCETAGDDCEPVFSLSPSVPGKPLLNKNATVTASGAGGGHAFIRVSAEDGDIDNGQIQLICYCGGKQSGSPVPYNFTAVHRTTASDVFKIIVTLGGYLIGKKIIG